MQFREVIRIKELINQLKPIFSKVMNSIDVPDSTWLPLLGKATVEDHGDVALPCHSLAGILKKAPQEIAKQISELVASDLQSFASVSSMSGFVNITAKPMLFVEHCQQPLAQLPSAYLQPALLHQQEPRLAHPNDGVAAP